MSNTPKIRFNGFTDDWEQRKLGDMCDEFQSGKSIKASDITDSGEYAVYGGNGVRGYTDTYNHDGDYALIGRQGALCGNMNFSSGKAYFTEHAVAVHGNADNDTLFLYYLLDLMNLGQYSGQSAQPGLAVNKIIQLYAKAPKMHEQKQISSFFKQLDRLITLHQRKCATLQKFKKSMLQKMFPQNGESMPEIRFAGFTGDWKQRKFSDLATIRRGLTYKPDNIIDGGKRVLRSSNINEDTFETHDDDVFVDENAVNIPYVHNGDILITSANGSSRLVGKHAIIRDIPDNSAVHGGFMLLASSDEPEFVNALMSSPWYTKFISVYVAGGNGAIGNLNKNDLDEQVVYVPQIDEMQKIGVFFSNLDTLITLHQHKLETLQKMKKALLQKMFV